MERAPIITLTSDWGYRDYYAAAVKGRILSQCPAAVIVDITHGIEAFNTGEAAFHLRNAYSHFPEGSIHIVAVDNVAGLLTPHCVVKYNGHFFIGADNGIFSMLIENGDFESWEIDIFQDSNYFTFSERDVFAEAACRLYDGKKPESLGPVHRELHIRYNLKPVIFPDKINGMVIHIDAYHNAILNISKDVFKDARKGRNFSIEFSKDFSTKEIHTSYDDVPTGEIVALFGSHGFLEIGINKEKAAPLLGLIPGDKVSIVFIGN
jgi:S-adenosyl-L-methionine hydrolase (adenosine-forming)